MSETLYIEVGEDYLQIPNKGDFLRIHPQESHDIYYGVCLSVNTTFRKDEKRLPLVEVLVDGRVLHVPLGIVEIQ